MNTQHDITVSGKPLNPPKPPAKPHMLLWIDTETTGLDPNQCELLEVGMQVTDLKAETRGGSLHLIVHPDNVRNWANHPEMLKAYEMHLANGLMLACAEAPKTGYDYKHTALNIHEFLNDQLSQYTLHPELNMDTQPPEPKKTFAEKLGTAIAIIISIALAALVVTLVIACIALIWSLMLEQHLI